MKLKSAAFRTTFNPCIIGRVAISSSVGNRICSIWSSIVSIWRVVRLTLPIWRRWSPIPGVLGIPIVPWWTIIVWWTRPLIWSGRVLSRIHVWWIRPLGWILIISSRRRSPIVIGCRRIVPLVIPTLGILSIIPIRRSRSIVSIIRRIWSIVGAIVPVGSVIPVIRRIPIIRAVSVSWGTVSARGSIVSTLSIPIVDIFPVRRSAVVFPVRFPIRSPFQ